MKWSTLRALAVIVAQAPAILYPSVAPAQGPIASGQTQTGTISSAGGSDTWILSANAGDSIVLRIGKITQTGTFTPRIRLYSPNLALLATASGSVAAEIAVTATTTGAFTVVVDDALGAGATGTYRLTLAQTGSAVEVSPGDEGGLLTNGVMYTGTIDVGDLDVWSVSATAGASIVVSMGELSAGSSLWPQVRIFSPSGALLGSNYGSAAVGMTVTAPSSGNFLVVVGDGGSGLGGSGDYRLTVALTGSAVEVSPGDEGGLLTNGVMYTGTIDVGDLDAWSVTASAGEGIVVGMGELTAGSSLSPWVRIFSPSGALLGGNSGTAAAQVAVTAPSSGAFLVVAGDGSPGSGGSGGYRLTMARTGSAVVVTPGDEGGLLTNGVSTGTIDVGDLDVWSAPVNAGNNIVVHMDELVSGGSLWPSVRIYGPSGALLGSNTGSAGTEVAVTVPSDGSILVVVADGSSGFGGSGPYRLVVSGILPPIAICHNSTNILTSGCTTNVPAADVDDGSFDPDGTIVSRALVPAGPYGLGNTRVTLCVVDNSGATGTCNAVITVLDRLAPTMTCPADITVPAAPGSCSSNVSFNVVASDNCGVSNVVVTPPSGSSFAVGSTTVRVTGTDTSGNTTNCSFNVTVVDTQLPGVSCPADITTNLPPGVTTANVAFPPATASDNCPGVAVFYNPPSGSAFPVGINPVVCTAVDAAGNSNTCSFLVRLLAAPPANEPPVADFKADPTVGPVPLAVSFIDTSTGPVTNRVWNFGDGGSGSLANVIHSYTAPGVYSVSLSVFGPGGSDTATRNSLVTVTNSAPQFTSPPAATNIMGTVGNVVLVKPNEAIGFSVGSYDADGNPVSCLWNLGDGSTSTDCDPVHVFTNCGPQDVSVTIGDGFASTSTDLAVDVTCPMDIRQLKLRAKFARAGSDTCAVRGTLANLPMGFSITNAAVALDVGGSTLDFQLHGRRQVVSSNGKIRFTYNKQTGTWTFRGRVKGDMKVSWVKYGITSAITISEDVTFPVLLILQSDTLESFDAEPPLTYRNRSGTAGTATFLPTK
ncbi:MAG TPA: HYR domain-containing protein [Verrucomicrobiae bacterium]|nr:HYR domain-containing protein [Verrucomicrobiae bacterium]